MNQDPHVFSYFVYAYFNGNGLEGSNGRWRDVAKLATITISTPFFDLEKRRATLEVLDKSRHSFLDFM